MKAAKKANAAVQPKTKDRGYFLLDEYADRLEEDLGEAEVDALYVKWVVDADVKGKSQEGARERFKSLMGKFQELRESIAFMRKEVRDHEGGE